jgi:predicted helicase
VNFIVRAVDDILKESFGIPDGLADHNRVRVLDFACGTGTFLLEVFQKIFENTGGPDSGKADLIVREHFLQNIFGFEYLIAPYTIAHLKLPQYLEDQGHPLKTKDENDQLKADERLPIFLTNTLEPIEPQKKPAVAGSHRGGGGGPKGQGNAHPGHHRHTLLRALKESERAGSGGNCS